MTLKGVLRHALFSSEYIGRIPLYPLSPHRVTSLLFVGVSASITASAMCGQPAQGKGSPTPRSSEAEVLLSATSAAGWPIL